MSAVRRRPRTVTVRLSYTQVCAVHIKGLRRRSAHDKTPRHPAQVHGSAVGTAIYGCIRALALLLSGRTRAPTLQGLDAGRLLVLHV